jgi:hypothetical protein
VTNLAAAFRIPESAGILVGLPTILPEPVCGTNSPRALKATCMACPFRTAMPFLQCADLIIY